MKILVILLSFLLGVTSYAQELEPHHSWVKSDFYLSWPNQINTKDHFYRGQATNLTSFSQMLDMMTVPRDNSFVTSRLLRTLKSIYPAKSLREIIPLIDKQVDWWRENKAIWRITYCHADVYGCSMPSVRELMGIVFDQKMLSPFIKAVFERQESGGVKYIHSSEMSQVLEFFDPVVSTSFYQSVADKFARDKEGGVGYVMILNDKNNRNCSFELKRTGNCFINHEEYLEEFEVPFWGYVLPEEFEGFIVEDVKLLKENNLSIRINQTTREDLFIIRDKKSCEKLKKYDFTTKRKQLLLSALKNKLLCNN